MDEVKQELKTLETKNAELIVDLTQSCNNEKLTNEANSMLVSKRAELHSQLLKFKKSSEDFKKELEAEKLGRAEDIAKLT